VFAVFLAVPLAERVLGTHAPIASASPAASGHPEDATVSLFRSLTLQDGDELARDEALAMPPTSLVRSF